MKLSILSVFLLLSIQVFSQIFDFEVFKSNFAKTNIPYTCCNQVASQLTAKNTETVLSIKGLQKFKGSVVNADAIISLESGFFIAVIIIKNEEDNGNQVYLVSLNDKGVIDALLAKSRFINQMSGRNEFTDKNFAIDSSGKVVLTSKISVVDDQDGQLKQRESIEETYSLNKQGMFSEEN